MTRQGVPLEDFKIAALEWAAGARGQVLVDAAAAALAEGVDSPTLRVLAGVPHMSADDEASEWASSVFEELGLSIPERLSAGARVAAASLRAAECLRGEVSPRQLAAEMWRTYVATDYASELDGFSSFDDAYDLIDDGMISGRVEDVDADVLAAARRLVRAAPARARPLDLYLANGSSPADVDLSFLPGAVRRRARLVTNGREVMWQVPEAVSAITALAASGRVVVGIDLRKYGEDGGFVEVPWGAFDIGGSDATEAGRRAVRDAALDALRPEDLTEMVGFDWALLTWVEPMGSDTATSRPHRPARDATT